MNLLRNLLLVFFLGLTSVSALAQEPLKPPTASSAAAFPPVPDVLAGTDGTDSGSPSEAALYYSGMFNMMLWISAVLVGGVGSFLVFRALHHHKRFRIPGDHHWPMLFTVTVPFLLLVLPIIFPKIPVLGYGAWGSKCFDAATYGSGREVRVPEDGSLTVELKCVSAQNGPNMDGVGNVSHSALGLNKVFDQYKVMFANGSANVMFPGEMLFVIWLLVSIVGVAIYQILLAVRQRFFVK